MKLSFQVPGHPIGWQRTGGNGKRRFTPKKTRDYERAIGLAASRAPFQHEGHVLMRDSHGVYWPMDAEYRVSFHAYFKDRRHGDMDNIAKALLDGMEGIVYTNDKRVAGFGQCDRSIDRENPRLVVVVEVLGE